MRRTSMKGVNNYVDIMTLNEGVTGSCNLVVVNLPNKRKVHFVVDCGLYQEAEYDHLNRDLPFNPEKIDFVIVTHAHIDHIGRLPYMVRKGFGGPIYATMPTKKIMVKSLENCLSVLRSNAKLKKEKILYTDVDLSNTFKLLNGCEYEKTIIPDPNVRVTFFNNAHMVGAALILVQIVYPGEVDVNLLFTGDWNNENVFLDIKPLPEYLFKLPITIIQESTYGDVELPEIQKNFRENVQKCVMNNGTMIALAYAVERTQEVAYEIKDMQDKKQLPLDVPIKIDGNLGVQITNMFLNDDVGIKPEMKNFLPQNCTFVDKSTRYMVLNDTSRKIVITSSGNGSHGPARLYIPEYISKRNSIIQFTGYTPEDTLGHKLKCIGKGETINIDGIVERTWAEIAYTSEFSKHARAGKIKNFLKQFENLKLVLINHGRKDVKRILAEGILDEVRPQKVGILERDHFYRVNAFGLVKTMSSKF